MNEEKKRTIKVGTVQLYSKPGQLLDNLAKAEQFVRDAATQGAELIVLPELFNIGYQYDESNYSLAEPRRGRSWRWMSELASELGIHLAGSLLVRKDGDIYNTFLLIAPDGRSWEYDKQRPFFWERAYFRPGHGPVIVNSDLGRIGLLLCWDVAHPELFASYAGKVDLILIATAVSDLDHCQLRFPDQQVVGLGDRFLWGAIETDLSSTLFGRYLQDSIAHLNVPAVVSGSAPNGRLETALPRAKLSYLLGTISRPLLWRKLANVEEAVTDNSFVQTASVINRLGEEIGKPEGRGDELVVREIELLGERPTVEYGFPLQSHLSGDIHRLDRLFNWLMRPIYEKELHQRVGEKKVIRWLLGSAAFLFLFYRRGKGK